MDDAAGEPDGRERGRRNAGQRPSAATQLHAGATWAAGVGRPRQQKRNARGDQRRAHKSLTHENLHENGPEKIKRQGAAQGKERRSPPNDDALALRVVECAVQCRG
jgi:hypothetical protein